MQPGRLPLRARPLEHAVSRIRRIESLVGGPHSYLIDWLSGISERVPRRHELVAIDSAEYKRVNSSKAAYRLRAACACLSWRSGQGAAWTSEQPGFVPSPAPREAHDLIIPRICRRIPGPLQRVVRRIGHFFVLSTIE